MEESDCERQNLHYYRRHRGQPDVRVFKRDNWRALLPNKTTVALVQCEMKPQTVTEPSNDKS